MKSFLSTLFLFLMTSQVIVYSQANIDRDIIVDGVIVSKEDGTPIPFVHVINSTTNEGVVSNMQGRFVLKMNISDSIIFSAIGFDKFVFKLKKDVSVSRLDITIEINTISMELEPVQIFAYKDERALKRAILDMQVTTVEDQVRMQLPGFYYGSRKNVEPTILSPISYIYSKVSKRAKEERKYKHLEIEYDLWRKNVFEKYNPILVQQVTGLEEDEVDDFMQFCRMDDRFVKLSTQYEVIVAINKCLDHFLAGDRVVLDEN